MENIRIKKLSEKAIIPSYQTSGASGCDLHSTEEYFLKSGEIHLFSTGLLLEIPLGFEGQIRPRSSLACKYGITVVNSPGTIDSDYRGDIKVGLINLSLYDYLVIQGDRIAQLVFSEIKQATFEEIQGITQTQRGEGGFGSTGK